MPKWKKTDKCQAVRQLLTSEYYVKTRRFVIRDRRIDFHRVTVYSDAKCMRRGMRFLWAYIFLSHSHTRACMAIVLKQTHISYALNFFTSPYTMRDIVYGDIQTAHMYRHACSFKNTEKITIFNLTSSDSR